MPERTDMFTSEDRERGVPALLALRAAAQSALFEYDGKDVAEENRLAGYYAAVGDVLAAALYVGVCDSEVMGDFEDLTFRLCAENAGDVDLQPWERQTFRGRLDGFRAALAHAPYLDPTRADR